MTRRGLATDRSVPACVAAMTCVGVQLILAAEGHEYRAGADGAVKPLRPDRGWRQHVEAGGHLPQWTRNRRCRAGADAVLTAPRATSACLTAPLVFRKSRERSTMIVAVPVHDHAGGSSVTTATPVGLEVFRLRRRAMKASASFGGQRPRPCAPAIRRWPAPCRPDRRTSCGTASRSMSQAVGQLADGDATRRPRRSRCSA